MAVKLIALDMDDTLLNDDRQISSRNCEAIRKAAEQGVLVTIATGRMYCSARPYAEMLGIDAPLVVYNGGLVKSWKSGETLFHQPVPVELAQEVLGFFREQNWYVQTYVDDVLYVETLSEKAQAYADYAGVTAVPVGERLFTCDQAPTKILGMADSDFVQEMGAAVAKKFGSRLCTASSKAVFLEMVHPAVNKARALSFVAEQYGIAQEEIMAIGDSGNDIEMLRYAGLGVAMGNARPAAKAAAQVVTADNNGDGVALAIEKYVLGIGA